MTSVADWVDKAEADWIGAVALNRRRRIPLPDLVCFHCQQCAEKYLKAFLVKHRQTPPRVHDLTGLLDRCGELDPLLAVLAPLLGPLNAFAVAARYPDVATSDADAKQAITATRMVRRVLRKTLGL